MKSNFLKSAIFYGLIFGAIMIVEFLVLNGLDVDGVKNPSLGIIVSLLNYIIFPLLFIFLAIKTYKEKYNEGFVSFSEILRIGAATTVIAALLVGIFNLIYNYLNPEFVDHTIDKMRQIALHQREEMLSQGAQESEVSSIQSIENQLDATRKSMNSFFSIPMTIVIYAVIGIICSLVLGAFLKKDKPQQ